MTRSGPGGPLRSWRSGAAASAAPAAAARRSGDQSRTQRLAGDTDVVERQLATALELLALLVALAGDDDDVARPAPAATARSIAARRSTIASTADASSMPAMISATIASGSSERGLSDVTIVRSARRAAISPMSGRLPRSRSPPQPKTQMTLERRQRPGRGEHVLQRVRRVRVVDDEREVLALGDRLEAPRHGVDVGQRRDDRRVVDAERARRRDRAEDVVDVEAAGQRRAQLEPSGGERRPREVARDVGRAQVGAGASMAIVTSARARRARAARRAPYGSSTLTTATAGPASNSRRFAAK